MMHLDTWFLIDLLRETRRQDHGPATSFLGTIEGEELRARLLAAQERARQRIATMDLLIATAAMVEGAPLVTRNTRDFPRVPGLDVVGY